MTDYEKLVASFGADKDYWRSLTTLQFTRSLYALVKKKLGSQQKFAALLGVTPSRVSQIFNGKENLTLESMVGYAFALGAVVHVHVAPKEVPVHWKEFSPSGQELPATGAATEVELSGAAPLPVGVLRGPWGSIPGVEEVDTAHYQALSLDGGYFISATKAESGANG